MKLELKGCKFGRLQVVSFSKIYMNRTFWNCKCDCGNEVVIMGKCLTNGNTKSCGCLKKENAKQINFSHGKSTTPIYRVWRTMLSRCENKNTINYYLYGKRGIKVCDSWHKFINFYKWALDHGYKKGLSIDRINNDGNYSPTNCHWANRLEQNNNTRTNRFIEFNNKIQTVAQWSRETGISQKNIYRRTKLGWAIEKILTTPVRKTGGYSNENERKH